MKAKYIPKHITLKATIFRVDGLALGSPAKSGESLNSGFGVLRVQPVPGIGVRFYQPGPRGRQAWVTSISA